MAAEIGGGQRAFSPDCGVGFDGAIPWRKLKYCLKISNEWPRQSSAVTAVPSSVNHRPERTTKPANDDRVASAETLDGPLRLAAGERRILTALAQYPQGRSKVQVAALTGYAATGGGFNNYLGALRSRGLIKGDGDSLRITETGIRELGSWSRCQRARLSSTTSAAGWVRQSG